MRHPLLALLLSATATFAADITLSPSGPISTLTAARDAARKAPKPVTITIADGTYSVTEPLVLGPEDSQVTWAAAPNAHPIITGGRAIKGWTQLPGGLWKADLPEVPAGQWYFEQLWINGRRATRARTPNKGFFHIASTVAPEVFPGVKDTAFRAFSIYPEQYDLFKAIPKEERDGILVTVTHAWAVGQCRLEALDDATQSILIKGKSRYPFVEFEPDQRYWAENFRAALDAPGEWYLDKAKGELLYLPLPGEDLTKAEVIAPVAEKFLTAKDVRDVTFTGLSFQYSNYAYPALGMHDGQAASDIDGVIEFQDAIGIKIKNCEVAHIGAHGIYFRNGCALSLVEHCHLHDLGASGVRIGETDRPTPLRVDDRIVVDDCIIQHGGRLHPSACGVLITHAHDCGVMHCDIGDFFYTGVSVGWVWGYGESLSRDNTVAQNHIHHLGWAYLSDMGGVYHLGFDPGTTVVGNHIHHVASFRYGGWGLYTDEGSTDVRMEYNLVHDTSEAGFHQHYGFYNTVRNNIFAFGGKAQIQRSRNEGRTSFLYEHNIVVWDPASPLLDGGEWNWKLNDKPQPGEPHDAALFRQNLYWPTNGQMPAKLANTWTWAEWQKMGRDAGSMVADPLFENLAARDFRLKPGSPADQIGFHAWDLSEAGVRAKDDAGKTWRALAAQGWDYPNWDTDAKPWPAPAYSIPLQTFEKVPLSSIGLRSAQYKPQGKGDAIGVSEEAASPIPVEKVTAPSKRSLKIQDAADLRQTWEPVFDLSPRWDAGTIHATFDAMAQPGADWFFELRTEGGGEFGAGPLITWQNGQLTVGKDHATKLLAIPANEWFRLDLTATIGSGKFTVTLQRTSGERQTFADVPCKPTWNKAHYVLWSSLGTTKTAFFLDNLSLRCDPK